jgi:hypothetical protein
MVFPGSGSSGEKQKTKSVTARQPWAREAARRTSGEKQKTKSVTAKQPGEKQKTKSVTAKQPSVTAKQPSCENLGRR